MKGARHVPSRIVVPVIGLESPGVGDVRAPDRFLTQTWPQIRDGGSSMSTSTAPESDPMGEGYAARLDEDIPTRFTRGVVDGFTEASEAFSHELEGTNRFPDLMGRSVAGVIRANARLLDELATVVRQMSDGLSVRSQAAAADDELDYERLADLVAQRLSSMDVKATAANAAESTARSRKA
jgi:hypothetical protein